MNFFGKEIAIKLSMANCRHKTYKLCIEWECQMPNPLWIAPLQANVFLGGIGLCQFSCIGPQ